MYVSKHPFYSLLYPNIFLILHPVLGAQYGQPSVASEKGIR